MEMSVEEQLEFAEDKLKYAREAMLKKGLDDLTCEELTPIFFAIEDAEVSIKQARKKLNPKGA